MYLYAGYAPEVRNAYRVPAHVLGRRVSRACSVCHVSLRTNSISSTSAMYLCMYVCMHVCMYLCIDRMHQRVSGS